MIISHTLSNWSEWSENTSLKFNTEMGRQLIEENHICVLVHHLISTFNRQYTLYLVKLIPEMLNNEFINSTIISISAFKIHYWWISTSVSQHLSTFT